jgi:hypothetical protein
MFDYLRFFFLHKDWNSEEHFYFSYIVAGFKKSGLPSVLGYNDTTAWLYLDIPEIFFSSIWYRYILNG